MPLDAQLVQLFRHNGYLKLPAALPEPTVEALKSAILRDIHCEVEPIVRDRQGRAVRISAIWERGGIFQEVLASPLVLDPLESLLGPNIVLLTNRHNHATLRLADDNGVYFHRDVLQWTRTIVTVIFYLEETTLDNGCTLVIPGSHLLPGTTSNSFEDGPSFASIRAQAVPVPMPAGGMLAIDSTVIHSAGVNHTQGSRISMTVGYHSVDELRTEPDPRRILVRGVSLYMGNDRA